MFEVVDILGKKHDCLFFFCEVKSEFVPEFLDNIKVVLIDILR